MDVLSLLNNKKRCLKRLLEINASFIALAEQGDLSRLPHYELDRGATIRALGMFDRKVTEAVREIPLSQRGPELSYQVQQHLDEQMTILQSLQTSDIKIMNLIESEMTRLKVDIASLEKSKDIVNRFKSNWMPESGEGLDQKI